MGRQTPQRFIGLPNYSKVRYSETAFFLTYGAETMVPAEVLIFSPRLTAYVAEDNNQERQLALSKK